MFSCPCCEQARLSWSHKWRLGYWQLLRCPHCKTLLSAHPLALALWHVVYVWVMMFFAYLLAYYSAYYIFAALLVWVALDTLNVLVIPIKFQKLKTLAP